jgi:hypothetical protein
LKVCRPCAVLSRLALGLSYLLLFRDPKVTLAARRKSMTADGKYIGPAPTMPVPNKRAMLLATRELAVALTNPAVPDNQTTPDSGSDVSHGPSSPSRADPVPSSPALPVSTPFSPRNSMSAARDAGLSRFRIEQVRCAGVAPSWYAVVAKCFAVRTSSERRF